ncbi:MAG: aminoglycoside phosphotransferase family protein [Candidatus Dormibacteraeota bacterium]|nr:aminoglycoside phosphotransferase family protein [Candidatus Dormibacteraeota bacterium]
MFTPAEGQRLHWNELPDQVRRNLETRLGAGVLEARTQPGGFSPGVAARLKLADGRRAFVKAVSASINPDSPGIYRREAQIAAALPASVPTPHFLDALEDGDWIALMFEDIEGTTPHIPWRPEELERVLAAVTELTALLTPAPIAAELIADRMRVIFTGWRHLTADLEAGKDDVRGIDPWVLRHFSDLVRLEIAAESAADGSTLLHTDIRADNVLLTPTKVFFVDWPWASRGAAWIDLLFMLPSVAMQLGPKPWEVFDAHPLGCTAPAAAVTSVVAAVAGFMIQGSRLPPPPGLPTVRAFQRDQGIPALEWLKRRTGWT